MQAPKNLLYSTKHLWTKALADGVWEAGITEYAQDLLGDIVFVEAPKIGTQLFAEQPCGLVESVKTGSDLHALLDGEVVEINLDVINAPQLINDQPYLSWIFKYKPNDASAQNQLLSAEEYLSLTHQ